MPSDPIAYQEALHPEHHLRMRQVSDPPADDLLRQILEEKGPEEGKNGLR